MFKRLMRNKPEPVSASSRPTAQIAGSPDRYADLIDQARALQRVGDLNQAEQLYDRILAEVPSHFDALHRRGVVAFQRGTPELAVSWYQRAIDSDPNRGEIYFNHASALQELKLFDPAIESYRLAITFDSNDAQAYAGLGLALKMLGQFEEAHASFTKAIAVDASYANGHYHLACLLEDLGRPVEALDHFQTALALQPDFNFLEGACMHLQMRLCDWSGFEQSMLRISTGVQKGEKVISPWAFLALSDSLELQLACAAIWTADRTAQPVATLPPEPVIGRRIRVGYFSADLHDHATAFLMAEMFESHDRNQFEIFAFSFGIDSTHPMRHRLVAAFDHFHQVRQRSDLDIAAQSRALGIDIAIDLKGYTSQSRPGIFAARAAPIQIAYLGFPATMAAPFIDYLIADPTLINPATRPGYTEHIITLPGTYQVSVSTRAQGTARRRTELGLPENSFVFCSFNSIFKTLPETFGVWMRILKRVDNSVLWLLDDNPIAAANLRRAAAAQGIDPVRLVFAPRETHSEHMARQSHADLFLDTFPCNAHTTASDALWAGLPILTRSGATFSSRVAASLLRAMDLDELIVDTIEAYETLAVTLATEKDRLTALRQRLAASRTGSTLYDASRFSKNWEQALLAVLKRQDSGLAPADIVILENTG